MFSKKWRTWRDGYRLEKAACEKTTSAVVLVVRYKTSILTGDNALSALSL
jgi:hypothetical protein